MYCVGTTIFELNQCKILRRLTDTTEPIDTNKPSLKKFIFGDEKLMDIFKRFSSFCSNMLQYHGIEEFVMAYSGIGLNSMIMYVDQEKSIRHMFVQTVGSFVNQ